jgi:hypothetical protein
LAGYSPGQPLPERMEYEFPSLAICEVDWTPPELRALGEFGDADLGRFWNPKRYALGIKFPRYLAPFHAWRYDQDEIMKRSRSAGPDLVRQECQFRIFIFPNQLVAAVFRP